jgi:methanogenic corrinoid protein MtbC1
MYSEDDLEKLSHLKRLVDSGHAISTVANHSLEDLRAILDHRRDTTSPVNAPSIPPSQYVEDALNATVCLDSVELERVLDQALAGLGAGTFCEQVVLPVLHQLGEGWRTGTTRVLNEHLASAVLRSVLGRILASMPTIAGAPRVVITTPTGQVHELGALVVAITAASEGWAVTYLGPNLPAEEIAGAAHQIEARAVGLSIVYPPDDPRLGNEIEALRRMLGAGVPILIGGRSAGSYQHAIENTGAIILADLGTWRQELERVRMRT